MIHIHLRAMAIVGEQSMWQTRLFTLVFFHMNELVLNKHILHAVISSVNNEINHFICLFESHVNIYYNKQIYI